MSQNWTMNGKRRIFFYSFSFIFILSREKEKNLWLKKERKMSIKVLRFVFAVRDEKFHSVWSIFSSHRISTDSIPSNGNKIFSSRDYWKNILTREENVKNEKHIEDRIALWNLSIISSPDHRSSSSSMIKLLKEIFHTFYLCRHSFLILNEAISST